MSPLILLGAAGAAAFLFSRKRSAKSSIAPGLPGATWNTMEGVYSGYEWKISGNPKNAGAKYFWEVNSLAGETDSGANFESGEADSVVVAQKKIRAFIDAVRSKS